MHIQRDDLIPGGTKRRALDVLLKDYCEGHIGYAGTILGHGALALAHACEEQGKRAHLFLSCNDDSHPMLARIAKTNAKIKRCAPVPVEQLAEDARNWENTTDDAFVFPPGFNFAPFREKMAECLQGIDLPPHSEIWCCAVSGVMAGTLRAAFPQTPLKIVAVTKSTQGDYTAPEKYHQPAQSPPPYPSCLYTDAKVWQFAEKHARPDALIWNIAG